MEKRSRRKRSNKRMICNKKGSGAGGEGGQSEAEAEGEKKKGKKLKEMMAVWGGWGRRKG